MSALTRTKTNKGLKRRKTPKGAMLVSRTIADAKEEVKVFDDYEWNAETIDLYTAPSLLTQLMLVPSGNTALTRTGNRIFLKRIYLKMMFQGSSSQEYAAVKLAIVRDSQPATQLAQGLTAAQLWYAIWQDTGNATQNVVALPWIGNNKRFKIIKNIGLPMVPTGGYYDPTAGNPRYIPCTEFKDIVIPVNEFITYQDSTTKNPMAGANYYVFAWSDTNANTTKVWCSSRLYFTDA